MIYSAPQKRFMANGRSRLTVRALTLSPKADNSWLNFLVCIWQTGVSSEGTTLMKRRLALQVGRRNRLHAAPFEAVQREVRGLLPRLTASPARVSGLPLNVTAPARDIEQPSFLRAAGRVGQERRRSTHQPGNLVSWLSERRRSSSA